MTPTKTTIAKNVAALRHYHGLSQTELAKKSALSQRTISNIESPERNPRYSATSDSLDSIAQAFGISTYHLAMPVSLDVLLNKTIERTVICFAEASPEGRENIARIAENEMRYRVNR